MVKSRVGIVGSRHFGRLDLVRQYIARMDPALYTIVSGGAAGVDSVAAAEARRLGFEVVVMAADWDSEGRSAGFKRNVRLVNSVDSLVAFWDGQSRGTAHAVSLAQKRGIWHLVVRG